MLHAGACPAGNWRETLKALCLAPGIRKCKKLDEAAAQQGQDMLKTLFRKSANRAVIDQIHGRIVAAARQSALYADYGVPDTLEGRTELVILHAMLVLRALRHAAAPGPDMAQDLSNAVFRHFDADLREMGVGDVTVPKRIKSLAGDFVGRCAAYEAALAGADRCALELALTRNIYVPGNGNAARLARYVLACAAQLAQMSPEAIAGDQALFTAAAHVA